MSLLYMTRSTEFIMKYHTFFGWCSNAKEGIQPEYLKSNNSLKKFMDNLILMLFHFQFSFKYLKLHYCIFAPFLVKHLNQYRNKVYIDYIL